MIPEMAKGLQSITVVISFVQDDIINIWAGNNQLFLHSGTSSVDGCRCFEPCSVVSSDMAISSVALSSLSIDSLLKSDVEDLRRKYHNALELKYVSSDIRSDNVNFI